MSPLISFYGDDFTGSTDVMEALASHGVDTVLFTRVPTASEFAPFAQCQAVGMAGSSRSQTPEWMEQHLPPAFRWLKTLGARYCHYKVCSTFDSSPHIGNIGRAAELGMAVFEQAMVPLVVGAPQLKRHTFSGHLFAGYQGETYRIDRHPVMSRHPVTPMHEADLRLHLAAQTELETTLANSDWPHSGIGLLDVHDAATQLVAGQRLLDWPGGFLIGSSGIEYALVKALTRNGSLSGQPGFAPLRGLPQTIVVSGSVSPTTERQIRHALQNGFVSVAVDAVALALAPSTAHETAVQAALDVLAAGQSPLIHTALGPATDSGVALDDIADGRKKVGVALGQILRELLEQAGLRRVIVAGGDSSSHALSQLDIHALTTRMPLPATPGSPLCVAHSSIAKLNGIEIALKGGQVGADNYFSALRDGTA